ncbi:ribosome biogenesis GTP-binding protein YihA/YsxC [Halocella sp. SP3-1]|uniref:ribosome biogenesis GTP-binding protein YihA/YsxC n=1 Tax=Halocella sp. SP3-1 TaxID=2382161 RepID=UPI000F74F460|nr:ribosome biogenesis GTP-binding protein YihA/YsxC [Halocella sp. SP3-1]AZO94229.1 YihA family ribosome biogenesis GTP-binding protein [Halocella sp. SP3-1]MTI59902.1 YihA family ribosome biogenesis GTP-binding protein [Bacillota bacterium]
MRFKNPVFISSAYSNNDYPQHNFPEIAFSGRSNVGKSSMINKLLNRNKLARTSSQPGRTQSINFFNIDDRFVLVDLPGYGFAKVPLKVKKEWGRLIDDYLYNRTNLVGIVQIIDARHKPTKDDFMMVNWLKDTGIPTIIAATKVDKLKKSQQSKQKKLIRETLQLAEDMDFCFFSAKTGEGKDQIFNFIVDLIEG